MDGVEVMIISITFFLIVGPDDSDVEFSENPILLSHCPCQRNGDKTSFTYLANTRGNYIHELINKNANFNLTW